MINYRIAACTQKSIGEDYSLRKSCEKLFKLYHSDKNEIYIDGRMIFENKNGLGEMYNKIIQESINDKIQRLVLVHDDVSINDIFFCEKLEEAFKQFDVVGLAGSAKFSMKSPVCWHNSPRESWAGAVEHPAVNGNPESGWSTIGYGPTPRRVAVIDGLFIAINLEKLGSVRFREQFKFHFYDIGFSLDCNAAGLKVGVTNIHVSHNSHGGYNTEDWKKTEQEFIKEYAKK